MRSVLRFVLRSVRSVTRKPLETLALCSALRCAANPPTTPYAYAGAVERPAMRMPGKPMTGRSPQSAATEMTDLRERLLALRADALRQLAEADHLDTGLLALLANTSTVLATIEAEAATAATPALDPASPTHARTRDRRRGGDPCADKRAARDEALRALARLNGNDAPVELVAREISNRLGRYRPLPDETIPERVLMRAVIDTGLPVPSAERIRKILGLVKQRNRLDDQTAPPH
jgi:hypothetical protein